MELRVILAKMFYAYDLEPIDKDLDWEKESKAWVLWRKPPVNVRIKKRDGLEWTGDDLPM